MSLRTFFKSDNENKWQMTSRYLLKYWFIGGQATQHKNTTSQALFYNFSFYITLHLYDKWRHISY